MAKDTKRDAPEGAVTREAPDHARRKSAQDLHLDSFGREKPDPVPMQPPVGYKRTPPLRDQIREMVRSERLRLEAEQSGQETFEEADDFEVGEDFDPSSPYEEVFEGVPLPPTLEQQANLFAEAMFKRFGAAQPAPKKEGGSPPPAPEPPPAPPPPPPIPPAEARASFFPIGKR